jgi:small subunit ribosomal protein S6
MINYELLFILKPNLSDEERKKIVDVLKNIIVENGGEITREEDWGKRTLAYEIKKVNEGYYTLLNFTSGSKVPGEVEKRMKHTENILRWLIIKLGRELKKPDKLEKKKSKKVEEKTEMEI